jgi:archaemetzincin
MRMNDKTGRKRKGISAILALSLVAVLVGTPFVAAARRKPVKPSKELISTMEIVRPFHKRLGKPKPGEWLERHKEKGQTFKQYLAYNPVRPTKKRKTIYLLPIGKFTDKQKKIIPLTEEFMKTFYNLPVKTMKPIDDSAIPKKARRVHPTWGMKQFLSTYILDNVLKKRLPKDGVVILGLTATDLWPGQGWNFVFGQASIRHRVGVWSIYRNGNADGTPKDFAQCLRRTIQTAVHETGHMFSMLHCTAYECGMCGSNSREESDGKPLGYCPECMAKVCWLTGVNPTKRFEALDAFCKKHQLVDDHTFYEKQLILLKQAASK